MTARLSRKMVFLDEVERLKVTYRRNRVFDRSRFENGAEHSWHVALMALVLAEHHEGASVDLFKVVRMILIHDLVEVYAGDTWVYDAEAVRNQVVAEADAASKLFGLLPGDQAEELRSLCDEFEAGTSTEAMYARAIDALQPLSNNLLTGDTSVAEMRPTRAEVLERKRHIGESSQALCSSGSRAVITMWNECLRC